MIFENEKKLQKSKVLLYPLVGNSHLDLYTPSNTYLFWEDRSIENFELMVYYDFVSKDFERVILNNPSVTSCYEMERGGMLYIVDMIMWADEVYNFLEGSYSKYSEKAKKKICKYYGATEVSKKPLPTFTVNIALTPLLYRDMIIKEYNLDENFEVGELFSKFNKTEETLLSKCIKNTCCKEETTVYLTSGI